MDRFKFRVWNKKHNFHCDQNGDMVISSNGHCFDNGIRGDYSERDGFIVEQCTGLSDKNGKLIYEGDIIRFCLNTRGYVLAYERAVVWDNESASFMIVSNLDQVKPRTKRQMPNIKTHNIEIIGNIHEQKD